MTRKKVLSMVFAFMLALNLFVDVRLNSALAAVKPGDVVSPQYTYTKKVVAQLWSDKPGVATCSGKVTVYDNSSKISLTVQLLRKDGSSWKEVVSWSGSGSGNLSYSITKDRAVSSGTYKVRVSGTITTVDGKTEKVSQSTSEKTF